MLKVEDILKAKKCGDIFTNDLAKAKEEYKQFAKLYHPDVNTSPDVVDVFANVTMLYAKALDLLVQGLWEESNILSLVKKESGKTIILKYLSEKEFELGKMYIARNTILYVIASKNKKYYDNSIQRISNIKYADINMKNDFACLMPDIIDNFETKDGDWCLVLRKTADVFLLEDLLKQQGGKLAEKHMAWVVTRLCNIRCFLGYNNLVHNGISLTTCFVSPKYHSILLLGGWWYATDTGESMLGTQKSIFDIMALGTKSSKISDASTDAESIRLIAKQLINNFSLLTKKGEVDLVPQVLKNWLTNSALSPFIDYKAWCEALVEAWGDRKFIKLEVEEKDIYKDIQK